MGCLHSQLQRDYDRKNFVKYFLGTYTKLKYKNLDLHVNIGAVGLSLLVVKDGLKCWVVEFDSFEFCEEKNHKY